MAGRCIQPHPLVWGVFCRALPRLPFACHHATRGNRQDLGDKLDFCFGENVALCGAAPCPLPARLSAFPGFLFTVHDAQPPHPNGCARFYFYSMTMTTNHYKAMSIILRCCLLLLCAARLYKQYSDAWVSQGCFIIMMLHLPTLYYCITPGAESCLCRRATRNSYATQAQQRVRIIRTSHHGKTRAPLCCVWVVLQHAARLAAAQAQHHNYLHHASCNAVPQSKPVSKIKHCVPCSVVSQAQCRHKRR